MMMKGDSDELIWINVAIYQAEKQIEHRSNVATD